MKTDTCLLDKRIFIIPGEPGAKGRPRFTVNRKRGYVQVRTPVETANYENLIILEYDRVYHDREIIPAKTMISMEIDAYYSIPGSTSKKSRDKMLSGEIRPTKKPDVDNVLKVVADALNKVAYHDDSQIVSACVNKYYSDKPRLEVTINVLP